MSRMRAVVARIVAELRRDPGEPRGRCWAFAVNSVGASHLLPARARVLLYRTCGLDVDLRAMVRPRVIVRGPGLTIGPCSTVNYDCLFDNRAEVRIGARVGVGVGVRFITSTHEFDDPRTRAGRGRQQPISVGDGAWIGSGATVLAGVDIGPGVVIGAGAVVTRDCTAHGLYVGIPARRIRDLAT